MKRLLVLCALLLLAPTVMMGQQLANSAHDFTTEAYTTSICEPCHTPHNADGAMAPLWNHQTTIEVYTLYDSPTYDGIGEQPRAISKMCLSCHDGTVAVDAFGGNMGGTHTIQSGDGAYISALESEHPISFLYDASLSTLDGQLHDPTVTGAGIGAGTIDQDMLFGGYMECASCHDVHNYMGNSNLLVKPNDGSALCLTCHDK